MIFAFFFAFVAAVTWPCEFARAAVSSSKDAGLPVQHSEISEQEADTIAVEAFHFFYPLVTMDVSRRQLTNIEAGKMVGRGPQNTFSHMPAFPSAEFREVVRPNFDTLYSSGWVDLTSGPVIVSVPDTQGRYYLLPMLDMWTDVFASPGKRTTGTLANNFALVPLNWKGKLPAGVERIESPTPFVWIIGRTQTNGPSDYEAVHKIQQGYRLTPLAQWGKAQKTLKVKIDPSVDMKTPPLEQVNKMSGPQFFAYAAELMKVNPPHITDQAIVARLKRIGITPGLSFSCNKSSTVIQKACESAPSKGLKLMQEKLPSLARVVNGWQMNTDTMGVYGNYYLKRAIVAMVGLGANQPEDAIYPLSTVDAKGQALDGSSSYTIHFNKDQLPPVEAFWSITLYDNAGFQVANPLNRFAIGDRDALKFNADGSLDIYISNASPGVGNESNWLPAPKGPFNLTMRLYAPKLLVLSGMWAPPAVVKK